MELEERKRPPLSADFHREQRYKSRNLQTTAAGSPNILRSPDEVPNVKILSSLYMIRRNNCNYIPCDPYTKRM
ncbi:hypothetical protein SAMN05216191_101795 [Paenibacillus jilunlii]|uniref:Uncharacterized protein n=1 Tax=Paenibacillus jilunlii TaxID=682956 RepID=A0A1G9HC29_9BACL|nr:hypothetical protein SAMN05216191_101795 [Paenibacillus jilunlii]